MYIFITVILRKRSDRRICFAGGGFARNDLKVLNDFNDLKDFTCGQSRLFLHAYRHSERSEESVIEISTELGAPKMI